MTPEQAHDLSKRLKGFHLASLTYLKFVCDQIRTQIPDPDVASGLVAPIERTIEILNEHVIVEELDSKNGFVVQ